MKGRGKAFFIILAVFSALFFISNLSQAATYNECTTLTSSGTQKISDEAKEIGAAYAASNLCIGSGWQGGLAGKTISLGVNTYDPSSLIGDLIRVDLRYPTNTLQFVPLKAQGMVHSWGCSGTVYCTDSWVDQCPSTNCCPPDCNACQGCMRCLASNWQELVKNASSTISNCPYIYDPNYIMVGGYTTRTNYDLVCTSALQPGCWVVNDECGDTTPELRPRHMMSQYIYFVPVSYIRPTTATVYNQTAPGTDPQWCTTKNATDVTITNLQTSLAHTNTYRPQGDPLPAAYTNYNPYTIPNYVPLTSSDYTQKNPACSAKPEPVACNAPGSTETCDGADNNNDGTQDESCTGTKGQCSEGTYVSNNVPVGSTANIASGNLYHSQQIAGITLSYNSMDTMTGPAGLIWPKPLGKGWTHNFNTLIMPTGKTDKLAYKETDGKITYLQLAGSTYIPEEQSGSYTQTVKNPDNTYTQTTKDQMTYTYNGIGKLISITDPNGKTTTLTYDTYGKTLTKITDQNGRVTTLTNSSYRIATIKDPKGNMYTLTYTGEFLTQIKDPLNNTWQFTYDTAGKMLTKKDPGGYITTYTYDSNGRLLTTTDPNGKTKTITYDQPNNQAAYTEKDGGQWTQKYDPLLNLPLEKTGPYGGKTKYQYDSHGNITKQQILNANGQLLSETNYTYDALGNMLTKTDALGSTTTYTYNALNKITRSCIVNPASCIVYQYDSKGNLLKQQSLDSNDQVISETNYQYDTKGNITWITDPRGAATQITYDTKNNPTQIKDPTNATTNIQYDANGNITQITDPTGAITKYEYNSLNKPTKITDAANQITQITYDANSNMTQMTDANTKVTTYQYNYLGQITQQTDSLNQTTTYTYGSTGCPSCMGADKLTALTDAKANATTFAYDLIGRLTNQTDPMAKQTTYTYDTQGNLTSKTDPNGNTIQYTYDALNRLVLKTYPDASASGGTTTYQYDAIGNLTSASNAYITYTYTYDALGRMTQSCIGNPASCIVYTYDANGNRTQMTSPIGTTSYVYNALNQLTQLVQGTKTFSFTYDSLGRRTNLTLPNGTKTNYTYNNISNLLTLTHLNPLNQTLESFTYTYDAVGNKLTKQDPSGTHNYTYDNTYQLIQSTLPNETFTYDPAGNRLTGPTTNDTYTHNANNQITQSCIVDPASCIVYTYDNNGNRYIKTQSDGTIVYYSYDYEGRLTRVETQKPDLTTIAVYKYDPFGRRIEKAVTENSVTTTTRYLYDGFNIVAEMDVNNNITTTYTYSDNIDEPLSMTRNSQTYFYHSDSLGSITKITDQSGNIVQEYRYDSFGNITYIKDPTFMQPFTFTGREYDMESGLYYLRARYYDPKSGTFLTLDPIGFDSGDVNLYRYVFNNPITLVDPLGLLSVEEAVSHYFFGKGKSVTVPFSEVDSGLQPKDFPGYTALVKSMSKQKGVQSFDFKIGKDIGGWAGNITYRFKGSITSNKCEWKSIGLIGAYDDRFDFNSLPWGQRDYWKEAITRMIGYVPVGQAYDIRIRGYRFTKEGGKW